MFKKSSFVLAATLVSMVSAPSVASASDITVKVRDHRTPVVSATVRDHRTPAVKTVRDHRTKRKNEIVVVQRKDCDLGRTKLRSRGFKNIRVQDCTGAKYSYFAKRNGDYYIAKMHAYSGSMQLSRLGIIGPQH